MDVNKAIKYVQIWNDFKKEYANDSITTFEDVGKGNCHNQKEYVSNQVEKFMNKFEEKYFPKTTREKINDIINKVINAKLLNKERDDIIELLVLLRDK